MKKKLVVLSGAGISAESGIKTFRDSDGLWENYNVEEVATLDGWYRNPDLVTDFYNARRAELAKTGPNDAHKLVAALEAFYDVTVVTQNIDDLHERGGSTHIIHLHGEATKACSENNKKYVQDIGYRPIGHNEKTPDGYRMRPFIVWFGEAVPLLEDAAREVEMADILIIIGTSLNVYPAAGLLYYAPANAKIYVIDPKDVQPISRKVTFIKEKATVGMKSLFEELKKQA
ncbi:MAG: NAD-dependent deacylase [Bacteroidales bacterium]|nr:NAD-dependent deacylase [Bacteroidales bacterium]